MTISASCWECRNAHRFHFLGGSTRFSCGSMRHAEPNYLGETCPDFLPKLRRMPGDELDDHCLRCMYHSEGACMGSPMDIGMIRHDDIGMTQEDIDDQQSYWAHHGWFFCKYAGVYRDPDRDN